MRRLHLAAPRPAPEAYPLAGATAPALEALPGGAPQAQSAAKAQPGPSQQQLFQDSFGGAKVIPIPTLKPLRPSTREASPVRRVAPRTGAPASRRPPDLQRPLEFHDAPGTKAVAEGIYCDAPVALPTHRIMAAAVDVSVVLIALGLFGVIAFACGSDLTFTRETAPYFIAVIASTVLLYRVLWVFGNGDSPGMRFAGLRLVDFDGRTPTRDQRFRRQFASVLSCLSAGLGLAWALVDEESLTWHDHISKTFPTPAT